MTEGRSLNQISTCLTELIDHSDSHILEDTDGSGTQRNAPDIFEDQGCSLQLPAFYQDNKINSPSESISNQRDISQVSDSEVQSISQVNTEVNNTQNETDDEILLLSEDSCSVQSDWDVLKISDQSDEDPLILSNDLSCDSLTTVLERMCSQTSFDSEKDKCDKSEPQFEETLSEERPSFVGNLAVASKSPSDINFTFEGNFEQLCKDETDAFDTKNTCVSMSEGERLIMCNTNLPLQSSEVSDGLPKPCYSPNVFHKIVEISSASSESVISELLLIDDGSQNTLLTDPENSVQDLNDSSKEYHVIGISTVSCDFNTSELPNENFRTKPESTVQHSSHDSALYSKTPFANNTERSDGGEQVVTSTTDSSISFLPVSDIQASLCSSQNREPHKQEQDISKIPTSNADTDKPTHCRDNQEMFASDRVENEFSGTQNKGERLNFLDAQKEDTNTAYDFDKNIHADCEGVHENKSIVYCVINSKEERADLEDPRWETFRKKQVKPCIIKEIWNRKKCCNPEKNLSLCNYRMKSTKKKKHKRKDRKARKRKASSDNEGEHPKKIRKHFPATILEDLRIKRFQDQHATVISEIEEQHKALTRQLNLRYMHYLTKLETASKNDKSATMDSAILSRKTKILSVLSSGCKELDDCKKVALKRRSQIYEKQLGMVLKCKSEIQGTVDFYQSTRKKSKVVNISSREAQRLWEMQQVLDLYRYIYM